MSLRTKSNGVAIRATKSIFQRLDDYWLRLRLQKMDIPAIHLVSSNEDSVEGHLNDIYNYPKKHFKCLKYTQNLDLFKIKNKLI